MYVVLVPVKPPALGKSRLGGSLGLGDLDRRDLAAAMALDTVEACRAATLVAEVLAVTDDAGFSAELAGIGCHTIPDGASEDLNGTLRQAAADAHRRWPDLVPVAILGDLPALRPAELDEALGSVEPGRPAYVADADGSGTTLYTAGYEEFAPRFGPGSAAAHEAVAAEVTGALPGLRRDVDDLADLQQARRLGLGPRTRRRTASLAGDGPSETT